MLEWARSADQVGWHSMRVIDRLEFPVVESATTLAAVAAVTSRVKLRANVLIEPNREPTLLATHIATV